MNIRSIFRGIRNFMSEPKPSPLAEGLNPIRPLSEKSSSEAAYARQDYSGRVENAMNLAKGNWGQRLDDYGHRIGFAVTCNCGVSYDFPPNSKALQENSGAKCDSCKQPFDFEGALHLRVDSIAAENQSFTNWLHTFRGEITTDDFLKRKDGKYVLSPELRSKVFDRLPQLRFNSNDLDISGPDFSMIGNDPWDATYEQSDPGAKNPLMSSVNPPVSRSWLLQRANAELRHARMCGTAAEVRIAEQRVEELEKR